MKLDASLLGLRSFLALTAGLGLAGCGPTLKDDGDAGADGGSDANTSDDLGDDPDSGDDLDGDGTSGGFDCEGQAEIILADGTASGYAKASDGAIHRCAARDVDPTITAQACLGTETVKYCDADSDCTDAANGRCLHFPGGFDDPQESCGCAYSCASDSDCPVDYACIPPGVDETPYPWPTCGYAGCLTDEDCASGECGLSSYYDGCFISLSLNCRDGDDACRVDGDCGPDLQCVAPGAAPTWTCEGLNCAIGRPLTVAGAWHRAELIEGSGWITGSESIGARAGGALPLGTAPAVSLAARAEAAAAWLEAAALEHASVASFSRHALELMSFGAPPELLTLVHQAALDEIEHARLCLNHAATLQGVARAPAPLHLQGLELRCELAEFVMALVEEGCVGESLGAAEAELAARQCADRATAEVLERIAADEGRHAALAFKTLAWIAPRLNASQRTELIEHAQRHLQSLARCREAALDDELAVLGVLRGSRLARLRREVGRHVVLPLLRQALESHDVARPRASASA